MLTAVSFVYSELPGVLTGEFEDTLRVLSARAR